MTTVAAAITTLNPIATVVAAPYAAAGPVIEGTSLTPNAVDIVSNKTFKIVEYNRSFGIGARLRATAIGFSNVWLEGVVTAWDGESVTIDGDLAQGIGTNIYSSWSITVAGQQGQQGAVGPVGPIGPSGGATGPAGPVGPPGSVWRNGNGVPLNSLGANGDYYLDDLTGNVHLRNAGTYSIVANILGPAGLTGNAGATGPSGAPGATGPTGPPGTPANAWRNGNGVPANTLGVDGDYYLNDLNGDVYQRASGTYAIVANILGPQGIQGLQGLQGNVGPGGPAGPTGPGYQATSVSSLAIVLGSQTFVTQAGLAYAVGARVRASNSPTNWMEGACTAYSGTNLTINVDLVNGSGTFASWNLNVAGQQGATGPTGASGAGTGNVNAVGTPVNGQIAQWTGVTTIQGIAPASLGFAPLANPIFTGDPQAPTPATADNDTSIATTAFVKAQGYITASALVTYAPLVSPALTGTPTAPTATAGTNTTQIASTAFVTAAVTAAAIPLPVAIASGGTGATTAPAALTALGAAPVASPTFSGTPAAPTPVAGTSTTQLATTQFVARDFAPLAAPVFTGDARAVTPTTTDNDTSIATTAYVQANLANYQTSAVAAAAYQPVDPDLTAIANITGVWGDLIIRGSAGWIKLAGGTPGQVLKTQGASANPAWAPGIGFSINIQTFAAAGNFTYTPTAGIAYATIRLVGAGGGGGGMGDTTLAPTFGAGAGGGGSGSFSEKTLSAAAIGASLNVTVGAAGVAGAAGTGGNGGAGGNTFVGATFATALCAATGGAGGVGWNNGNGPLNGGAGGVVTGAVGDIIAAGNPGGGGSSCAATSYPQPSGANGGPSHFGGSGKGGCVAGSASVVGGAGSIGGGGGGAMGQNIVTARTGGAGGPGYVTITEYIIT